MAVEINMAGLNSAARDEDFALDQDALMSDPEPYRDFVPMGQS